VKPELNPILAMAMEQVKKDIGYACQRLRISPGKIIRLYKVSVMNDFHDF